jgi:hypothetical protein
MRPRIGLLLLAWVFASPSFGQRAGLRLPEPPQQRRPWRAPADLPTNVLSAAETLFAQGFPDPRGCEYRELEVEVGDVWRGEGHLVKTRGWVLPAKAGEIQRFAICWDGLVYPTTNLGGAADFRAEITNSASPGRPYSGFAIRESRSVLFTGALSTRRLLLLRLGQTEAALKNWAPARMGTWSPAGSGRFEDYDPYLELAGDWAWALFDRMICAHMRGDEALALATARKLADVQPRIEVEAARRGFQRPRDYGSPGPGKEEPYLDFLQQLPQILADLERRARESNRVSVVQSGLTNFPNQTARIAALVRDLELVHARQWSQPGGVDLAQDSILQALIREGDPAVEPLLDCLETDKRLTRSVGFGRDFFRGRTVIAVASAARVAVQAVLHASFGGGVAEMRAYWSKYKGWKLEERWYVILKDDSAGMGRWLEAAGNIAQPVNVTTYPGTGVSEGRRAPTNAPIRLRGEPLRGMTTPSVGELLARRAVEIPPTNLGAYDLSAACQIALHLTAWDPPAAMPVAKVLMDRCRMVTEYSTQKNPLAIVAKLTMVRAQEGDTAALADYAAWLQTLRPEQFDYSLEETFTPLCRFPTNSALQAAADRMFGDTNSAWARLPWKVGGFFNPAESELINVPAFRRLLSRQLDRTSPGGYIEWRRGSASYQITNHLNGSRGLALPEAERPAEGTRTDLRWCDWIAWSLSNGKSASPFNPFAPRDKRDEAIARAKRWLEAP